MKKSKTLSYAVSVLMALLPFAAFASQDGAKQQYKLDVKDFNELKVKNSVNVEYICSPDSAGNVVFECDTTKASLVMFSNVKNRLTIELAAEASDLKGKGLPTVKVYSSMLQKVENSGDSTVSVLSILPIPKFSVTVIGNGVISVNNIKAHEVSAAIKTGSGHIVLEGETQRANYQSIGTGPIEAGLLKAGDVNCKMLGTGPIDCYASGTLKIMGMGSGKVIYDGNPKKVINRSIGVKIIDFNSKPAEEGEGGK